MKRHLLLLALILTIGGCGGGGKGPLLPPSNPPSQPGQPTDVLTRIVGPTEVESGGVANLELTTGDSVKDQILAEADVSWSYQPTELSIKKLNDSRHWQVSFPQVSNEVVYTISFVAVQASIRFRGQTQIRVIPSSPVEPLKVYLRYPADWPEDVRTVGNGTKLKIVGEAYPGSYPIAKLRVTDQGTILQEWPFNGGQFEVDLEKFGSPGRKWVRVEAVDSQGNVGSAQLELIHDPARLDALARDFLLKYATVNGRVVRFMSLSDGPPSKPIKVLVNRALAGHIETIRQGVDFWTRYTGLNFVVEITQKDDLRAPEDYGSILLRFETVDTTSYAKTWKFYTDEDAVYKVGIGLIALYRGWLTSVNEFKSLVIAHELGHVLLIPDNNAYHTKNGSFLDASPRPYIHPFMQKAVHLLYAHQPGDPL